MKRSELNGYMRDALKFADKMNYKLPPFVRFTCDDWKSKGEDCREIAENYMGWDVTDFGTGDFMKSGLILLTLRNGANTEKYPKNYGEKLMIAFDRQITPYHMHKRKMEDIINRGGALLVLQCFYLEGDHEISNKPVEVSIDGQVKVFKPCERIELKEGESICLTKELYHSFWGEGGCILIGEVSQYEDYHDDTFYDEFGLEVRMKMIEDEPVLYPLFDETQIGG